MPAATFLWLPLSVWRDSWGILPLKECGKKMAARKTQGCRLLRRRRGETNTYPIFYNLLVLKRRGEVLKFGILSSVVGSGGSYYSIVVPVPRTSSLDSAFGTWLKHATIRPPSTARGGALPCWRTAAFCGSLPRRLHVPAAPAGRHAQAARAHGGVGLYHGQRRIVLRVLWVPERPFRCVWCVPTHQKFARPFGGRPPLFLHPNFPPPDTSKNRLTRRELLEEERSAAAAAAAAR